MKSQTLLFCMLRLLSLSCKKEKAGNQSINYQVFNTQTSGLPSNVVTKIAIDKNSNIWVGTLDHGLAKYNGQQWIVYTMQNSPLPSNGIFSLTVDKSNTLWIGTNNGLASLNQQNWKVYNSSNSGLTAKFINALCSDSAGKIWLGGTSDTLDTGLFSFDGTAWQHYNQRNSPLPSDIIHALATDKKNAVIIGTSEWQGRGGFLKLQSGGWQYFNSSNSTLKYNRVDNVSISNQGTMLFSSSSSPFSAQAVTNGYLQELDAAGIWKDLSPDLYNQNVTNNVTAATYDHQSNIWVATTRGAGCSTCDYALMKYNRQGWAVYSPVNGNFPGTYISDIKADKEDNIWVAGPDMGLIKIEHQ